MKKPPRSEAIATCWQKFRRDILAPSLKDVPEVATSLAQASFYFGALAALDLMQEAMEHARSPEVIELALEAFRDEVAEHIGSRAAEIH